MIKKILLLSIPFIALSCSSGGGDEPPPPLVTGVEIPASQSFIPGEPFTIQGSGFLQDDKIIFRTNSTDVTVEILSLNGSSIKATTPSSGLPPGNASIVLKRGSEEIILGSVTVKAARGDIYCISDFYRDGLATIHKIDYTTRQMTLIQTLGADEYICEGVCIPCSNTYYGFKSYGADPDKICSFNFTTKTYTEIANRGDIVSLGIIDNKLHGIIFSQGNLSLAEVNTSSGLLTTKASFGNFAPAEIQGIDFMTKPFFYDSQSKQILPLLSIYDGVDEYSGLLTLNINTSNYNYTASKNADIAFYIKKGADVLVGVDRTLNYGQPNESSVTDIFKYNPTTQIIDNVKLKELGYKWEWHTYDAVNNTMYFSYAGDASAWSYDFDAMTYHELPGVSDVGGIFHIR